MPTKTNHYIESIQNNIEPLRKEIMQHPLYAAIEDIEDLKIFMQYHVYAVWDFMSLLKTLQNNLTCTSVPWFPQGSAQTRHLINEIVVGEESDLDLDGNRKSHFELYLDAMKQCGASTTSIEKFIELLKQNQSFNTSFEAAATPQEAKDFVNFTFDIIKSNKPHLQAAIFTFGREDLIPGMFVSMVHDIHLSAPERISIFKYYLDRHIEVDGDHHSHLAIEMITQLCGNQERLWKEAEEATIQSLYKRIHLWNGALKEILIRKNKPAQNFVTQ